MRRVDGNIAPSDHHLPLTLHRRDDELLELGGALLVLRQEQHADAVRTRGGELRRGDGAEELVGEGDEDSGAVARVGVGAGSAAVSKALERRKRPPNRLVRRLAPEPRDEGDAARIVLVGRVVEPAPSRPPAWEMSASPVGREQGAG